MPQSSLPTVLCALSPLKGVPPAHQAVDVRLHAGVAAGGQALAQVAHLGHRPHGLAAGGARRPVEAAPVREVLGSAARGVAGHPLGELPQDRLHHRQVLQVLVGLRAQCQGLGLFYGVQDGARVQDSPS